MVCFLVLKNPTFSFMIFLISLFFDLWYDFLTFFLNDFFDVFYFLCVFCFFTFLIEFQLN